jgi:uncharacterized protein (UPF0276 family)
VRRRREEEDLVKALIRGVGLGLRWEFIDDVVERAAGGPLPSGWPDFFEVSPENYLWRGGRFPAALARIAERSPIVTHGLSMSLGGTDPLDESFLRDLGGMLRQLDTPWHSDHLCWSAVGGRMLHDLLPVPRKRATVERVAERIRRARDALGLPLAVENVSSYWHPGRAEMTEPEFLAAVCEAADCGLLLDVNNAYVNATNFGWDPSEWLRHAPLDRVVQIHVAGHEWFAPDVDGLGDPQPPGTADAMIVDTHGAPTCTPVLELLESALLRTGPLPVVLERDSNIPPLGELLSELEAVRGAYDRALRARAYPE